MVPGRLMLEFWCLHGAGQGRSRAPHTHYTTHPLHAWGSDRKEITKCREAKISDLHTRLQKREQLSS